MNTHKNIVLTGFMGAGKTTVGKIVAQRLMREFIDTDELIERRLGVSIAQLFANHQEHIFRAEESLLCEQLGAKKNLVIATGGGTLVSYENLQAIEKNSIIFCLDAGIDTILKRIRCSMRPLALKSDEFIRDLYDIRNAAYSRIFYHIYTSRTEPVEVVTCVLNQLGLHEYFSDESTILVRVRGQRSYPLRVNDRAVSDLHPLLLWCGLTKRHVHVVSNATVWDAHGDYLQKALSQGDSQFSLSVIRDGEQDKTIQTALSIYDDLLRADATRDTLIIGFGGGVVLDVAGYVAATFMRGLADLVNIPTSLLAMVDASIGGKTGVNLASAKNMIGAFKQPRAVVVDPTLLQTLPRADYVAGFAEIIKHAIIGNIDFAGDNLASIIQSSLAVKKDIIEQDAYDDNKRLLLNLGHTFGHAIESATNYQIKHGEAVSLGIVMACELSHELTLCSVDFVNSVKTILQKHGLPVVINSITIEQILQAIKNDKKRSFQTQKFIIPKAWGDVVILEGIDENLVKTAIGKVLIK